jgi:hypothetical protein
MASGFVPVSCDDREQPARGQLAGPVAEHARRKAIVRDDQPGRLGWVLELPGADRGQRQVTERAAPLPAFVTALCDDTFGLRTRVDVRQSLEPIHAGETVPTLAATLRILEVIRQGPCVVGGEAESGQARLELHV